MAYHCLVYAVLSHIKAQPHSAFLKHSISFHPLPEKFCLPCFSGPQVYSVFLTTLRKCYHSACSLP